MKRLAIALVILSLAVQPVAAINSTTITVEVVDQNGNAVSGAQVTAEWDDGEDTAETKSNGQALVDVPQGAEVEFSVTHDDYLRNHPVKIDSASGQTVEVDVAPSASASITVTDSSDSTVEDASVIVRQDGRIVENGPTDASGLYSTDKIEEGKYSIEVNKPGHYRTFVDITASGHVEETVQIKAGSVDVTFSVTDDYFDPEQGVEGASIQIGPDSISTSSNGERTYTLPVNTEHEVTVEKDGYTEASSTLEIDEDPVTTEFTITKHEALFLEADNERVVTGEGNDITVINQYDEPASSVDVLVDGDVRAETNANGEAVITLDEPGEHSLQAAGDVYSDQVTVEAVSGNGNSDSDGGSEGDDDDSAIVDVLIDLVKTLIDEYV